MKHTVLIVTMAITFVAGLFVAGQALGAGQEKMGKSPMMGSSSMGEMGQMQQTHSAAANLNREQIREMQKLLNERGCKVGQTDGFMGPRTRAALRQFQTSEGLTKTGSPDRETLRALAPSVEKQEFFGLSPEFGEKMEHPMQSEGEQMKPMMEQKGMDKMMNRRRANNKSCQEEYPAEAPLILAGKTSRFFIEKSGGRKWLDRLFSGDMPGRKSRFAGVFI